MVWLCKDTVRQKLVLRNEVLSEVLSKVHREVHQQTLLGLYRWSDKVHQVMFAWLCSERRVDDTLITKVDENVEVELCSVDSLIVWETE